MDNNFRKDDTVYVISGLTAGTKGKITDVYFHIWLQEWLYDVDGFGLPAQWLTFTKPND
jgi:hypothetical protein